MLDPTGMSNGDSTMSSLLAAVLAIGLAPIAVPVDALPFDLDAWRRADRVEVRIQEEGKPVVYTGVPLATVLEPRLRGSNRMAALRALADAVILVQAADGYQAAVAAVAVAMDPKGERYLLALARDGKPLDERQGPVRLIVPGDPQRVRWVRGVNALRLVQLNTIKPAS
jgi:DMSO/TMAO reductase YedYZ molybdopterin-dependent catalytic subunit